MVTVAMAGTVMAAGIMAVVVAIIKVTRINSPAG
jgi:hypothetical protein